MTGEVDPAWRPPHRYIPGKTERHEDDLFSPFKGGLGDIPFESLNKAPAWILAMKLFEEGFFWETHELLEPVWMACPPNSPQKLLVQAVIQQANARLKELMGRQKAALRLKAKAEALWREAFADPSRTILGLTESSFDTFKN